MSSPESSDEDEGKEMQAALRDALQCSFVQQVFSSTGINGVSLIEKLPSTEVDIKKKCGTFEEKIAKVLARRLDDQLEEIEIQTRAKTRKINRTKEKSGIQLVSSGSTITGDHLIEDEPARKRPRSEPKQTATTVKDKDYMERATESAVSPEWIYSKVNTKYWKDLRKEKVVNMKTIESTDNDARVCQVLNDG